MDRTNVVRANAASPSGPGSATVDAARSATCAAVVPRVGSRRVGIWTEDASMGPPSSGSSPDRRWSAGSGPGPRTPIEKELPPIARLEAVALHLRRLRLRLAPAGAA